MSTFTICRYFVETCAENVSLMRNSLLYFVHDGPLRIAIDSKKKALRIYHEIGLISEPIADWLKYLTYRSDIGMDFIELDSDDLEDTDLFFNLCARTTASDPLICDSKSRYNSYPCGEYSVLLVDAAEAKSSIEMAMSGMKTQFFADKIIVTQGNESPIFTGDGNAYRKTN